jgi:hypothetical protein
MSRPQANPGKRADSMGTKKEIEKKNLPPGWLLGVYSYS